MSIKKLPRTVNERQNCPVIRAYGRLFLFMQIKYKSNYTPFTLFLPQNLTCNESMFTDKF